VRLPPYLAVALAFLFAAAPARAEGPSLRHVVAKLQGLDKVTARVTEVTARIHEETRFGTLAITPQACLTAPPTEAPESAAFLEIRDVGPAGDGRTVFSGWMFATSPALSALEHPVYDVWVVECAEPLEVPEGEPGSASGNATVPGAPPGSRPNNGDTADR
jgi:hypothetical protein